MEIYLLRHGDAEAGQDIPDFAKALSEEGRRKVTFSGRALARMISAPPAILSSPLTRARQSAELVAAEFDPASEVRIVEELIPPGDFNGLLTEIKNAGGDRVLLVGHEPLLGRFIWAMMAEEFPGAVPMRKASMARVDLKIPVLGGGSLIWFLPPEILRELGEGKPDYKERP
jgi:phosphohistidine phosphatase